MLHAQEPSVLESPVLSSSLCFQLWPGPKPGAWEGGPSGSLQAAGNDVQAWVGFQRADWERPARRGP